MDDTMKKAEETAAVGDEELAAKQAEAEAQAAEEAARAARLRAQEARARADQWKAPGGPKPSDEGFDDEEDDEDEEPPKKKHKGLLIFCVILAVLAAACVGAYFYFDNFFKDHFFIHSEINGHDVSFKTADEARKLLAEEAMNYSLAVKGRNDLSATLGAQELGVTVDDQGGTEKLLKAQKDLGWNWVQSIFRMTGGTVEFTVRTDREVLKSSVAGLPMFSKENVVEPTNAVLDTSGEKAVIVPETQGAKPNLEKAVAAVAAAADSKAASVDLEEKDCYEHPLVTKADETLNTRLVAWNQILSADVTYVFGENKERVTGADARSHIIDDGKTVRIDESFAHDLVYAWGRKYDTFGLAREFKTHSGKTVTIPYGGDYGWCSNKDKTIADLQEALRTGATGEREPVWLFRAMGWDNGDLTGTYVEVSIAEQHLWCYKNGELIVDTPVVTGSLAEEDTHTIPGCFAIDAKVTDKVLGAMDSQGYENPVSFWMPFDGGRGLHDAPWRVEYGGDIYKTNGSHGCVNTPYDAMAIIYNNLQIGNAVVVY